MKPTKTLLILIIAALISACGSEEEKPNPEQTKEPAQGIINPTDTTRRLTIVVGENPLVDAQTGQPMTSRGSVITTSTLSSFSMKYQDNLYSASKNNDTWTTDPDTWPDVDSNTPITFHAYNGGTYYYNSGTPYISFTADENAASTSDLLVATTTQSFSPGYNNKEGAISLTFDHACAAVDFKVRITKTVATKGVTVKSIVLNNVYKKGDYKYSGSWESLSSSTNYTLTSGALDNTTYQTATALPDIGTVFIIPQTLSSFTVTYQYGTNAEKTNTIYINQAVAAGNQYTITLTLGTTALPE